MNDLFKNIVKLPLPHTARSYGELTPVYKVDEVAKTVASFEAELAKANERVKELEGALKIALSDKTLELVRCGIGGNYGGNCYETAILKHHAPLVEMQEQLRKGGDV